MEINKDTQIVSDVLQTKTREPTYSKLAIARESATVACIPAEIRKQAGEAKSFKVEKGKLSGVP